MVIAGIRSVFCGKESGNGETLLLARIAIWFCLLCCSLSLFILGSLSAHHNSIWLQTTAFLDGATAEATDGHKSIEDKTFLSFFSMAISKSGFHFTFVLSPYGIEVQASGIAKLGVGKVKSIINGILPSFVWILLCAALRYSAYVLGTLVLLCAMLDAGLHILLPCCGGTRRTIRNYFRNDIKYLILFCINLSTLLMMLFVLCLEAFLKWGTLPVSVTDFTINAGTYLLIFAFVSIQVPTAHYKQMRDHEQSRRRMMSAMDLEQEGAYSGSSDEYTISGDSDFTEGTYVLRDDNWEPKN